MANLLKEFRHLFRPDRVVEMPDDSDAFTAEERAVVVNDMRTFVSTGAYKEYRKRLSDAIDQNRPDPRHGTDVASCFTFKQEGLREALRILDHMISLAEEKNA